jgi:hypothetical protein
MSCSILLFRFLLVAATLAFAAPTTAMTLVPPQPSTFDAVNARLTVDSCEFPAWLVRVTLASNVFRITQQSRVSCSPPGAPQVADIRLGTLPSGDYRVELYRGPEAIGTPAETLAFTVRERAGTSVNPLPLPFTDYTGVWWNPQESGWGLSLHQSGAHLMVGAWFVYNSNGQPEWYTLQGGQWTSPTRWTATLYRTTGPSVTATAFDPTLVFAFPSGTAVIEFRQDPGGEGLARFTYALGGNTTTKVISRIPF